MALAIRSYKGQSF